MNKPLRSFIVRLAISIFLIIPFASKAGHILGTNITYYYVSPNNYSLSVYWFRDCQGLTGSQTVTVCYSSVNAGISGTATLQRIPGTNYLPQFPYWPPMPTSCTGGSAPGIELVMYEGLLILPSAQTDWIISYSTFPQNIGINQNFMYVSTKIDNINYPVNTSAQYTQLPTFIYCVNQPAWDNFAATDMDGDSLSYHIIPILDNDQNCPHAPFISPVPAFPSLQSMSSTPVAIDSTNGSLTFHPTMVGSSMVAVQVDEHRNGVLINSSTAQHVMYIVTGCTITGIDNVTEIMASLYPNPASGFLTIEMKNQDEPVAVEVIDVTGKIFQLSFNKTKEETFEMNIQSLVPGCYSLRIVGANTATVQRFVKL